jgi:DNA-binding NarL/FixJ family response regulator
MTESDDKIEPGLTTTGLATTGLRTTGLAPTGMAAIASEKIGSASPGRPITIALVDDHPVVRMGMRFLLEAEGMRVVGEAENGSLVKELVVETQPDLVLMDLRMPVMDGAAATAEVLAIRPQTRVLVLTTYDDDVDILRAVEAGAVGYLLKDAPQTELVAAIHAALRGETVLSPTIAAKLIHRLRLPKDPISELTPRELEVLQALAVGGTNADIGRKLFISEATVKTHLLRVFTKLDVEDRTTAVTTALQRGLITLPVKPH